MAGVRWVRFGVAGIDPTDLEWSVRAHIDAGYAACEVQFVKEFTLKEPEARRLGEIARDAGLALSVHAPYFAQLTTPEADRLKNHLGALHHACHLAHLMGARVVVCHPGSNRGEPEDVFDRVDRALAMLGPRIAEFAPVKVGLETPGRISQFGSLGDIALLCERHPFATPVVDFAHLHAVSGGSLTSRAAFEALFGYITERFTLQNLLPLHCHFTDNRFGPAGEITHVPYGEGSLRVGPLAEGAAPYDLALNIVSEERWVESHAAILDELRRSGAALVAPGGREPERPQPGLVSYPDPLPIEPRGPAHYLRRGRREVRITNVDKVLFPDEGYTKGDLLGYYFNVAPLMLPFLTDRPLVMQRIPDGIYGEAFYEKQAPRGRPEWVRTVPVPSDGGRRTIDFVVADDPTTLVWLAQIASVECHAWTSTWPDLDQPDFAVLDLDPHEPITFDDVRAVGRLVKVVLDRLGLTGFPKTSGGAGLQVFIPLTTGHSYPEVRRFCSSVGELLRAAYPERVTLEPSKPKRAGKVFVDANQNSFGKTLVAPYSVRPYPGAPVSMPLRWEELDEDLLPEMFTIATAFDRLATTGDLFARALTSRQDLHRAMAHLDAGSER